MRMCVACLVAAVLFCGVIAMAEDGNAGKVLRHVVMFRFKDTATPEKIKEIEEAFRALPSKIPEIQDFEWGVDLKQGKSCDGFTHLFFVTFKDKAGLDVYSPHPAHKAFVEILKPYLDKCHVIDYFAEK